MKDIEVVDNFMPVVYQDTMIETLLYDRNFPWSFLYSMSDYSRPKNISGAVSCRTQYGIQHIIVDHNKTQPSEYYELFEPLLNNIKYHYQSDISVVRIKAGMVFPTTEGGVAYPHTDYISPHRTLVYYVNDTDGDTVFYREYHDGSIPSDFTVEQRVSPEQGRVVMFDGLKYHSTEYPTKDVRAFINVNFKLLDI